MVTYLKQPGWRSPFSALFLDRLLPGLPAAALDLRTTSMERKSPGTEADATEQDPWIMSVFRSRIENDKEKEQQKKEKEENNMNSDTKKENSNGSVSGSSFFVQA